MFASPPFGGLPEGTAPFMDVGVPLGNASVVRPSAANRHSAYCSVWIKLTNGRTLALRDLVERAGNCTGRNENNSKEGERFRQLGHFSIVKRK